MKQYYKKLCILFIFPLLWILGIGCEDESPVLSVQEQALKKCPLWIQPILQSKIDSLATVTTQDRIDTMLRSLTQEENPLYYDEIAYALAHIPNHFITDDTKFSYFYPELYQENASQIYAMDDSANDYTPYAELIEVGTVKAGGDYYTTVRYQSGEDGLSEYQLDEALDKEAYYKWIVFPSTTVLAPVYVNNQDQASSPEEGEFWRTSLASLALESCPNATETTEDDTVCPVLKESIQKESVLWEGNQDDPASNGALGAVYQWMRAHMYYTLELQDPVCVETALKRHAGACGEYSILTTYAGRIALIPTRSATCMGVDHAWNEFYNGERWVVFDTTKAAWIDSNMGVEGAVLTNEAGSTANITSLYAETATLEMTVLDKNRVPIPDAEIELYTETRYAGTYYTKENGKMTETVSAGIRYFFFSRYKEYTFPQNTEQTLVISLVPFAANQTYTYEIQYAEVDITVE